MAIELIEVCAYCANEPVTTEYEGSGCCDNCKSRIMLADDIRIKFKPYNPPINNSLSIRIKQGKRVIRCLYCGSFADVHTTYNIILCKFCGLFAYKFNAATCYTVYLEKRKIDYSVAAKPFSPFGEEKNSTSSGKIEKIEDIINGKI